MYNIGLSTGSTNNLQLNNIETLEVMKDENIRNFEIFFQSLSQLTPANIFNLKETSKRLDYNINSIHPFMEGYEVPNLFSDNKVKYIDAQGLFYRFLEIAVILKSDYLIMHGPLSSMDLKKGIEKISILVEQAAKYDVTIALENKDYGLFSSPDKIRLLRKSISSENFGFVLDYKSAWKKKYTPKLIAEAMGNKLLFSHVSFQELGVYGLPYRKGREIYETISYLEKNFINHKYLLEIDDARDFSEIIGSLQYIKETIDKINVLKEV